MSAEIVCIGQAVIDCITRGREEQPYKKNVYRAQNISLNTGGDAVNEAMILTHLGHSVKLVCGVGKDVAGNLIIHEMEQAGVDVSGITQTEMLTTPIANLMVNEDGTRSSINSTATMLDGYLPSKDVMRGAKVVSLASLFRAPLDQKETIIRLAKAAKKEGAVLCVDTKIPTYRRVSLDEIMEILPLIDYIFPNDNEAEYYTGRTEYEDMARYLHDLGVKNVIVKTGAKGCVVCGEEDRFSLPAYRVNAVDSTGGGDNFVAGFISGVLHGWTLKECCEYGTACAAVCVQYMGATTGVQNRDVVEEFTKRLRHSNIV
ncbi:MAG: carbohydrate kinase family protein [Clostridiales bacterium]|nr:carbohydrate kinase family protein [Clostridiales bacterium]